jgi:hypothetical protein
LSRVLYGLGFSALVNLPKVPTLDEAPFGGTDEHLEDIYREHVRTLTSMNSSRGVKTVYIGQIMNAAKLESEQNQLVWWPLVRAKDAWPLQKHFNSILRSEAAEGGASYVDAGVENFQDNDFVDEGHFSSKGADKFATLIAHQVDAGCQ